MMMGSLPGTARADSPAAGASPRQGRELGDPLLCPPPAHTGSGRVLVSAGVHGARLLPAQVAIRSHPKHTARFRLRAREEWPGPSSKGVCPRALFLMVSSTLSTVTERAGKGTCSCGIQSM